MDTLENLKDYFINSKNNKMDLTRKNFLENRLYYLAYYDNLTNLPNEKYFKEKLQKYIRINRSNQGFSFVIFYLEINDLDNISNIIGSQKGNKIVKKVADKLKKDQDLKLICHYYGDKFLLLYPDLSKKAEIRKKAENILKSIRELWEENSIEYYLSCKIGITVYPDNGSDALKLITRAHHALHIIEDSSRNYQIYDQQMYLEKIKYIRLKNDLRKAISNKELYLHYQPKISLKTKEIVALEALLRWKHPTMGEISPAYFIPIAEQSNLINQIDRWVISKVVEEFSKNKVLKNSEKIVSVNLSVFDLKDDSLISFLNKLIKKNKISPSQLDFEITESVFLDSSDSEIDNLHKLKDAGFFISLDDFGKGYSSLAYLNDLPLDILKLDKSFIKNIDQENKQIMIKKVIELAHELNLRVVGEGVEHLKEVEILEELDCDFVQGYYFYYPMPLKEIENVICKNCNPILIK